MMRMIHLWGAFGLVALCTACANESSVDNTGTGASAGADDGGLGGGGGGEPSAGGKDGAGGFDGAVGGAAHDETGCVSFDEDPAVDPLGRIVINEVFAGSNDVGEPRDYVELYNRGDVCLALEGYQLRDTFPPKGAAYMIPGGIVARPGAFVLLRRTEHFSFGLSQGGEGVELFDPDGTLLDASHWGHQEADLSWGRSPDGADGFMMLHWQTPGSANAPPFDRPE